MFPGWGENLRFPKLLLLLVLKIMMIKKGSAGALDGGDREKLRECWGR